MTKFFVLGAALIAALVFWQRRATSDDTVLPYGAPGCSRTPRQTGEVTLLIAGDTAETDAATETLAKNGLHYPFVPTRALVTLADIAVANLEAPLTDGGDRFPLPEEYQYRAPLGEAEALAWAGFDIGTLANNHARDYGAAGIDDTRRALLSAGITPLGAGSDAAIARQPVIVTVGDVKIGFLSYCEDQFLFRYYLRLFATGSHAGVARLSDRNLATDIARLRPLVDIVVVILHAGDNYQPPTRDAIGWGRLAIELGADAVVAHHPHVVQPVVLHEGRPIVLSVGNYAFGTPGRRQLDYGTLAILHATGKQLDRLELGPIAVNNDRVSFQPRTLSEEESEGAVALLRAESAAMGTSLVAENGRAVLYLHAEKR